ncbi:uncharacterized protein CTRU02_214940 [Colletotrichum truncatum]|uniref:Uncharacterized protein n=1 Tax=Colletotrichum truncatum TaxID=5467 RepID=A0ACC3YE48_COLTU|nr:uncharacterized protein CTRU02_08309 [Colletotrichum truncatum]KAF6790180.1 hypothetical protein CTRU02_08309 [Colletotrichum truncatum]
MNVLEILTILLPSMVPDARVVPKIFQNVRSDQSLCVVPSTDNRRHHPVCHAR